MNRIFLSWDKPVCRAVAERLLSLGNDLHRHLVLVPTRESGRQLREFLASISHTQAIFAPQVIPADQFPRMEEKEETASALEELAGWLLALGDSPHRLYPRLFPHTMPEDFPAWWKWPAACKPEARHGEPGRFLHHGPPCQFGQRRTMDGHGKAGRTMHATTGKLEA